MVRDPIERLISDFHHLNSSSEVESFHEFANSNEEVMKFGYYAGFGLSYFEHVFEIKFIQHINRIRTVKYLENV